MNKNNFKGGEIREWGSTSFAIVIVVVAIVLGIHCVSTIMVIYARPIFIFMIHELPTYNTGHLLLSLSL